jgi:hypothetical protein
LALAQSANVAVRLTGKLPALAYQPSTKAAGEVEIVGVTNTALWTNDIKRNFLKATSTII